MNKNERVYKCQHIWKWQRAQERWVYYFHRESKSEKTYELCCLKWCSWKLSARVKKTDSMLCSLLKCRIASPLTGMREGHSRRGADVGCVVLIFNFLGPVNYTVTEDVYILIMYHSTALVVVCTSMSSRSAASDPKKMLNCNSAIIGSNALVKQRESKRKMYSIINQDEKVNGLAFGNIGWSRSGHVVRFTLLVQNPTYLLELLKN